MLGRYGSATEHLRQALVLSRQVDDRTGEAATQARAHSGLGDAHRGLDNPPCARHHYQRALALYTDLGLPDAEQIRAHLAAIGN